MGYTIMWGYGQGYGYGSGGGYGYGSGEGSGEGSGSYSTGIVWDGCTNDDSVGDEYDDTCSAYYDTNPDQCGNYDTETFVAADLCCACMSYGSTSTTYTTTTTSHEGMYGYYEGCQNDDSIGDEYDDTCSAYYDENTDQCGNYDTEDFSAASMCCGCMGYSISWGYGSGGGYGYGSGSGYGYGTGEGGEGEGSEGWYYEGCENDDSLGDEYDDTCSSYYDENPDQCGSYDTEDFSAASMCCGCKGYTVMWGYRRGGGYGYGSGGGYGYGYGNGEGSGSGEMEY
jgi:hypothetical protein